MGVVYKAYDPELERAVALKLLHAGPKTGDDAERRQARLLREAKALARLSHPNVVAVHDVGTYEGDVFLATEFVEGAPLKSVVAHGEAAAARGPARDDRRGRGGWRRRTPRGSSTAT